LPQFVGTNIGATILLARLLQEWQQLHANNGSVITDREFWAAVHSMAIGVNYGAFSISFGASLAGLLWRDSLYKKDIRVLQREFARVNFPIIAFAMAIACTILVGEVYIARDNTPHRID